jgi:hypothetical protein
MITLGGRANNLLKISFLETESNPPDLPDGVGPEGLYGGSAASAKVFKVGE